MCPSYWESTKRDKERGSVKCRLQTFVFKVRKQWDYDNYCCHVFNCMVKLIVHSLCFTLTDKGRDQLHLGPAPPPHPPGWPLGISIFFALDGRFLGVGTIELWNPRGGDEKRRQMPRPLSALQHFSLIAKSNSAILSILMCYFLFQLMPSFVIVLGF